MFKDYYPNYHKDSNKMKDEEIPDNEFSRELYLGNGLIVETDGVDFKLHSIRVPIKFTVEMLDKLTAYIQYHSK